MFAALDNVAEAGVLDKRKSVKKRGTVRRANASGSRRLNRRRGRKLVVIAPRNRHYRAIRVVRLHGHSYWGFDHFHSDSDAWKWLAFTAITLKVLDNIDEASQRAHEAAQIDATTAAVGDAINWSHRYGKWSGCD